MSTRRAQPVVVVGLMVMCVLPMCHAAFFDRLLQGGSAGKQDPIPGPAAPQCIQQDAAEECVDDNSCCGEAFCCTETESIVTVTAPTEGRIPPAVPTVKRCRSSCCRSIGQCFIDEECCAPLVCCEVGGDTKKTINTRPDGKVIGIDKQCAAANECSGCFDKSGKSVDCRRS